MPNNVGNKLTIVGTDEEVLKVLDFIKIEEGAFGKGDYPTGIGTIDFNKITPMPKWVYGNSPDINGISRSDEELYGRENTTLGWAIRNWGTKWNAYSQRRISNNTIYFETAWSGIPDLIYKLAWIFPDITIGYSYADEDTGYNTGIFTFRGVSDTSVVTYSDGSKEAYDLAFNIRGDGTPASLGFIYNEEINNYEYNEEVDDEYERLNSLRNPIKFTN